MRLALTCLLLAPGLLFAGEAPREDAENLIRRVIAFQEQQHARTRDYAYRVRKLTQDLRKNGTIRQSESETYLVTPAPGGEYRRLISKNGRPLPPEEEAEEERKYQEFLEARRRLTPEALERQTEKKIKDRAERYEKRLKEALEVFDFHRLPDDTLQGEPVRVFRFTPKPGYDPGSRATKFLSHMEGVVWIDAKRNQLAKLRLLCTENVNFLAGIFGKVSKGSEAVAAARLQDGLWLLDRVDVSLDARLYFLKGYRQNITFEYEDYRKPSVDVAEPTSGTVP